MACGVTASIKASQDGGAFAGRLFALVFAYIADMHPDSTDSQTKGKAESETPVLLHCSTNTHSAPGGGFGGWVGVVCAFERVGRRVTRL